MLPILSQQLLAQWSDLPVARQRPHHLHFLGIRTAVNDGYAFFLGFADRDFAPCLAVKVAREPAAADRLQHEWHLLNHLQEQALPVATVSLPRPLLAEVIAGVQVLVTTAPPGRPLQTTETAQEDFTIIGNWLVQLACATRTTKAVAAVRQSLEETVAQLQTTFTLPDRETAVVEAWIPACLAGAGEQIDLFAAHGNLRCRHIWRDQELTIVNWEWGQQAHQPLHDIFTFVTAYCLPAYRRGSYEQQLHAFRTTYLADGPYTGLACRTLSGYCQALNIPLQSVVAHFGLFLARAALAEYRQLLAAAARGYLPLVRPLRQSQHASFRQAIKDQLWINLLRLFIKEHQRFERIVNPRRGKGIQTVAVRRKIPVGRWGIADEERK